MYAFFLICATLGGTILICQMVLTVLGLAGDTEIADDLPDASDGMDDATGHDAGHDADADGADQHGHGSYTTWLFGILSFRTMVAGSAFLGLGGLAGYYGGLAPLQQGLVAIASGSAAVFGVHWLMKQIGRLSEDGTVRVERAIGHTATVYLMIPPAHSGQGKVQIKLQNRLMEFAAVTSVDRPLKSGSIVRVVAVTGSTLEVAPEGVAIAADSVPGEAPTRETQVTT